MRHKTDSGHGGRRPGAGAPKGNMNAFKHGLSSRQYDRWLKLAKLDSDRKVLARITGFVETYQYANLSRAGRRDLALQTGLFVLKSWYVIRAAIRSEPLLGYSYSPPEVESGETIKSVGFGQVAKESILHNRSRSAEQSRAPGASARPKRRPL
jgi:hypothetical protein